MSHACRFRIRGLSVLSAIGTCSTEWRDALLWRSAPTTMLKTKTGTPVFKLGIQAEALLEQLQRESELRKLDRATLCGIAAADLTLASIGQDISVGCIAIGSSRGPSHALESTIEAFLQEEGRVPPLTSPITTAGNLASWVAQRYLGSRASSEPKEPLAAITTSMTCSSAFHSLLVAMSFLKAKLAKACLFGGAEACLTPYTIAQLEALRIYTDDTGIWPCRPMSGEEASRNSVTLGEASGTAVLLSDCEPHLPGDLDLLGLGWAMEEIPSATGISIDGMAFRRAMKMAASLLGPQAVDAVIAHAPGSIKGDQAELKAIRETFGNIPVFTTKHLTGHTYGASGMVSLSLAKALLEGAPAAELPYPSCLAHQPLKTPRG
jgi:3-oxoacyl-[acyl-carrier-protein] synthase II